MVSNIKAKRVAFAVRTAEIHVGPHSLAWRPLVVALVPALSIPDSLSFFLAVAVVEQCHAAITAWVLFVGTRPRGCLGAWHIFRALFGTLNAHCSISKVFLSSCGLACSSAGN